MKFKVNTEPLKNALELGIINANISKYYAPSCVALVSLSKNSVQINLEAMSVISELKVPGMGEEGEVQQVFVDSLKLKQLVNSFDTNVTDMEITEDGLILKSGSSKFTLPKVLDNDATMKTPALPDYDAESILVVHENWKFIDDNQMYAAGISFTNKAYTMAWFDGNKNVLVGDFDNSLFTHSEKGDMPSKCLLSDTIINLLNTVPDGSEITQHDKSYILNVKTDGYEFLCEFLPGYEDDPEYGDYSGPIVMDMMQHGDDNVVFDSKVVSKFLSQALLLSEADDVVFMKSTGGRLTITGDYVDFPVSLMSGQLEDFQLKFRIKNLASILSKYTGEESIHMSLVSNEDGVAGITVWSPDLTTTLAGLD